jgi:uncharacterized protein (TIGR00369 family)
MKPTEEELAIFRQGVEQVPYLQLLGIKLESLGLGEAEMSMLVQPKHLQTMGIVHGGAIASILDSVTWWAGFVGQAPEDRARIVSVDLKLNYLAPLKSGRATARAKCKKAGSRLCYVVGEIFDESGRLVADGSSTLLVAR